MLVSQPSFSPCSLFPLLSHHRSQLQEHENSHKFNFLVLCVSLTTQKHKVVIHGDKLSCHSYIKETKTFSPARSTCLSTTLHKLIAVTEHWQGQ